jgi:superfamily II DNA or RNA helicase
MLKVYIKPTSIWLYPYTLHQCYKLEKTLGIYDIYLKRYTSFLYEFDKEENSYNGIFKVPRGLGIEAVKSCLDGEGLSYTIVDDSAVYASPRKIQFSMRKDPRNEEQVKSISFLNNTMERQKMLCLDVGRGKTYCATHFIKDQGISALIISYNLSDQWHKKIEEYTDCVTGKDIILIVGSSFLEECIKKPKMHYAKIYICSLTTLSAFAQKNGKADLQKIVDSLGIGIKVFDEAHTRYRQFNAVDLNMQVAQTLYLTATPGRSQLQEKRMFAKIYSHVSTFGNTIDLYNDHYTIRFITYNSSPPHRIRSSFSGIRGLRSTSYTRYLFDSYPEFAHDLVKEYSFPIFNEDRKAKILIIIDWLKDMQLVANQFREDKDIIKMELTVGTYCQLIRKDREDHLKRNIIIGSIASMQNGKDIENLQAIFCFTQFSSEIVSRQLLGRLRPIKNKEVVYYDIADKGVPDIMKQRSIRKRTFEVRSSKAITEYLIHDMKNVNNSLRDEKEIPSYFRSVFVS